MAELDRVAAEIVELAQSWNGGPVDLTGPASHEDIAAAERELGVVFPRSYRAFLRCFGAGNLYYHEIFGIPGEHLWGDVVMMNQVSTRPVPPQHVKFTEEDEGYAFYLDTAAMNSEGECPVVELGPDEGPTVVANSFLEFLRQAREGVL